MDTPGWIRPMLATAGAVPTGDRWAFEIKHDGARASVAGSAGGVMLRSRSDRDLTQGQARHHEQRGVGVQDRGSPLRRDAGRFGPWRRRLSTPAEPDVAGQERVRARYAAAAGQVRAGQAPSCASADPAGMCGDAYDPAELAAVAGAGAASLGCGNPLAVAELVAGDTVLDLGSGSGLDVLLSVRRVGPDGWVYGLDMTEEMLDLARRHAADAGAGAGATNVEFLRGNSRPSRCPTRRWTW